LHESHHLLTLSLSEAQRWILCCLNLIGKCIDNRFSSSKFETRRQSMKLIAFFNCVSSETIMIASRLILAWKLLAIVEIR
jgi:hypothetical protein